MRNVVAWTAAVATAIGLAVLLAGPIHEGLVSLGWRKAHEFGSTFRYVAMAFLLVVLLAGLRPWRGAPRDVWGLLPPGARPLHGLYGALLAAATLALLLLAQAGAGWVAVDEARGAQKVASRWGPALARAAGIALLEEVFFRGYVLDRFRRGRGFFRAAVASAVVYALPHAFKGSVAPKGLDPSPAGALEVIRSWGAYVSDSATFGPKVVGLVALGTLLAAARARTRSLWFGVGFHAGAIAFLELASAYTHRSPERNWAGTKWLYDGPPAWAAMTLLAWALWPRPSAGAGSAPAGRESVAPGGRP